MAEEIKTQNSVSPLTDRPHLLFHAPTGKWAGRQGSLRDAGQGKAKNRSGGAVKKGLRAPTGSILNAAARVSLLTPSSGV